MVFDRVVRPSELVARLESNHNLTTYEKNKEKDRETYDRNSCLPGGVVASSSWCLTGSCGLVRQ